MKLNKSELENSISLWEKKVEEKCLPTWEELPGIELYMDQIITLVDGYLANLGSHKAITQPMVNNYVKLVNQSYWKYFLKFQLQLRSSQYQLYLRLALFHGA